MLTSTTTWIPQVSMVVAAAATTTASVPQPTIGYLPIATAAMPIRRHQWPHHRRPQYYYHPTEYYQHQQQHNYRMQQQQQQQRFKNDADGYCIVIYNSTQFGKFIFCK